MVRTVVVEEVVERILMEVEKLGKREEWRGFNGGDDVVVAWSGGICGKIWW